MAKESNGKDGSPFITTAQAALMLKLSPRTLDKMRQKGTGPEYFKILNRAYYTCKTVSVWSDARLRKATFDPPKEGTDNPAKNTPQPGDALKPDHLPNDHTQAGDHPVADGP